VVFYARFKCVYEICTAFILRSLGIPTAIGCGPLGSAVRFWQSSTSFVAFFVLVIFLCYCNLDTNNVHEYICSVQNTDTSRYQSYGDKKNQLLNMCSEQLTVA